MKFIKVTSSNRGAAKTMIGHYTTFTSATYLSLTLGQLGKALSLIDNYLVNSFIGYENTIVNGLQYGFTKPDMPFAEPLTITVEDLDSAKKIKARQDEPMIPTPKATMTPPSTNDKQAALELLLSGGGLSEDQVNALIDSKVSHLKPVPLGINLTVNDKPIQVASDYHHKQFKDVLTALSTREPVYLYGTASGGKTTMYKQLAASLSAMNDTDIKLITSVQLFTQFEITGYKDANGVFISTIFHDWFVNGGLLAIDEFDRSMAKALTALNQMIENKFFTFPDGQRLEMHKDCYFIASGNTPLNGNGSGMYNASEAIDAATRDRFIAIEFEFDAHIEDLMSNGNDVWLDNVRRIRSSVAELGISIVVSTRPIRQGSKLIAAGVEMAKVISFTILKGLDSEQADKIINHAKISL